MDQTHAARFPGDISWPALAGPLVAAEDALARLDERLRTSAVRDGFASRAHYVDACASLWLEGELVPVEDLVLHDAAADVRAPTPQLTRAQAVLQARRLIGENPPGWAFAPEGAARLAGRERLPAAPAPTAANVVGDGSPPDAALDDALSNLDTVLARAGRVLSEKRGLAERAARPDGGFDAAPDERPAVGAWRQAAGAVAHLPPLLAAGLLWDRWETAPPVPQRVWLGRQMAAAYLRERGKAAAHLPAVNAGLRTSPWERRRARDRDTRLQAWLDAVRAGAQASLAEHDRLSLSLALLERKCARRRATSRLPDLIALVAAHPLVTVTTAAQALGLSQRAAHKLIAELGLREVTGRGRYRAWML